MDDVAEVRAGPFPPGHLIGEPRENALGQRLVRRGWCIDIKSLPLRQAEELVVDAARLAGGVAVDRQLAVLRGLRGMLRPESNLRSFVLGMMPEITVVAPIR
jgi:hypothetical protein